MSFGLNPTIHAPKRLAFMALLAHAQDADFTFVRDALRVSDSDLSKQAAALVDAGYVEVLKFGRGRGGSTTYRITKDGLHAYQAHRSALEALLAGQELGAHGDGDADGRE